MTESRPETLGDGEAVEETVVHRVAMPLEAPIRSGIHAIDSIHMAIVRVRGDGEEGVGYSFAFSANEILAVAAIAEDLAQVVEAERRRVRSHWSAMWNHLNFIGREGPGAMAMAAIDTAIWDLAARRAGVPLYELLGATERSVPAYAAGGWLSWQVERVIEEARSFAEAGYRAYKMRVGSPDWHTDVDRVRAVRRALPREIDLIVDVNQAWNEATALQAGRALEEFGLLWIEEPIDAEDFAGQARLARRLATPIAAGETLWGRRGFKQLLEAGGVDVIQLDLMRCGGITPFMAIAALVEAAGLPIASHLFTPVSAHLLAATRRAHMAENLPSWFDPLFEDAPQVIDGRLRPSGEPGVGLRLSPAALEHWEAAS